jgi:Luciferase-like monooxygenase
VTRPKFGIFDHIEDIPGTPTSQLFKERLELIKMADEAGFGGFHLAEHHGGELCMAPSQEVFIAAASQVTKNIHLGPMVKLLPMHSPVRRPNSRDRFVDSLGLIQRALSNGEISSEGSRFYDFPTMPLATKPYQERIPVLVSRQPLHGRTPRDEPDVTGAGSARRRTSSTSTPGTRTSTKTSAWTAPTRSPALGTACSSRSTLMSAKRATSPSAEWTA